MVKTKEEAIARLKHSIELKKRWLEESDRRLMSAVSNMSVLKPNHSI